MSEALAVNKRIELLRGTMFRAGIDYYVVYTSDPHGSEYIDDYYKDRAYLSGFTGSAGTLVVSESEAALFVDGRYHIQAEGETEGTCVTVYKLGNAGVPEYYEYLAAKLDDGDVIGFNGNVCPESEFEKLREKISENSNAVNITYKFDIDLTDEFWIDRARQSSNPVFMLPPDISGRSSHDKLADIRNKLKEKNADVFFIASLDDICYLFNLRGSDIKYGSVAYLYAYVTKDSAVIFLKGDTYDYNTKANMLLSGINVLDYENVGQELCKLKDNKLLLDKSSVNAYLYNILSSQNTIEHIDNYKILPKHIKNETECLNAKKYGIIDSIAVIYFIRDIKERVRSGKALMNTRRRSCLIR